MSKKNKLAAVVTKAREMGMVPASPPTESECDALLRDVVAALGEPVTMQVKWVADSFHIHFKYAADAPPGGEHSHWVDALDVIIVWLDRFASAPRRLQWGISLPHTGDVLKIRGEWGTVSAAAN
jgi:hypothetical protein